MNPTTLAKQYFGLHVTDVEQLAGEVDLNYRLTEATGTHYLLKISSPNPNPAQLEFETAILAHLNDRELPFRVPKTIATYVTDRQLRLQSWVPGRVLGDVNPITYDLLRQWGETAGHLSRVLVDFDHPFAHREYKWDPSRTLAARPHQRYMTTAQRELTDFYWNRFVTAAQPKLDSLRKSVNYNDAHEHNLLVSDDRITGVIDVGDALFTHTINELAIACAYAGMNRPDPVGAMAEVVRGYHAVFPVEEDELAVLFDLVTARVLITVATAAHNQHIEPENEYLQVSARPAWELLERVQTVHPAAALAFFRHACGYTPHPARVAFNALHPDHFRPVVRLDGPTVRLDMSVGSRELGNNRNFEDLARWTIHTRRHLEDSGAKYGVGGYNETRPFYTTDAYQDEGNHGPRWRTVHLGLDVWARTGGTPVFAPCDGKIHSTFYDPAPRSYGYTIILEHHIEGVTFYTLYGHLAAFTLQDFPAGTQVKSGQQIATFGPPDENGGWPPHLHFQVTLDMLGLMGDFPGVAYPADAEVWLGLCPNPAPFFRPALADKASDTDVSPSVASLLARRKTSLGYSLSVSYSKPLHIVRGARQYLYDTTGRRYLDTVNNVAHVGHEHPVVVEAARRQNGLLNTNARYLHEEVIVFAEELAATLPDPLSVVHFVNSGSEANELALRMAEAVTGNRETIALEVGYHGNTGRTIDVSSYKFDGKGGKGCPAGTHLLPLPDPLRGRGLDPLPTLKKITADGIPRTFIAESILSCGGQVVLPDNYLNRIYERIRATGGVCIADEVQVGLGRVGGHFWAFELQGVVPDIVTIGKPLGNGHPLAAVICTPQVASAFANGMEYFNTFGGNPVSSAVGRAVLRVIREDGLQQRALETGEYLKAGLSELQEQFPIIGDVRGHGLFLGFELVGDNFAPAAPPAAYLKNRMRQLGFLLSTDGPHENVIKLKPPLCFTRENADLLLEYLGRTLREDGCQVINIPHSGSAPD